MTIYNNNSKYTIIYYGIIDNAIFKQRSRDDGGIYEEHHIIPKSIGGTNEPENLVFLTPKEHYICHRLLPKMVKSKFHYEKMIYALWCMINGNGHSKRYSPCGKIYQQIKEQRSKVISTETREKLRQASLGYVHSDNSKKKMSESRKNKVWIKKDTICKHINKNELDHYIKLGWQQGRILGPKQKKSPPLTEIQRNNLSNILSRRIWIKKDGESSKHIDKDELQQYINNGWARGRNR